MKKMYAIPMMVFSVLLSLQTFSQCSVSIVGGGCEGTKLRAVATGNTLLQLIWKIKDSVVYTSTAGSDYFAKGITVAGGNGVGSGANQLGPVGVWQDKSGNLYIVDCNNNRVQKWAPGATEGITVAGGNGLGSAANQLYYPFRIVVDEAGNIYVSDTYNNRVQKWAPGATEGVTVAGGNGAGSAPNQLSSPRGLILNADGSLYIADSYNDRIQKWDAGATEGVTVAGGNGFGPALNQITSPNGISKDAEGNLYLTEPFYNRILIWKPGASEGAVFAGGLGSGDGSDEFDYPGDVFVDWLGNVFVNDGGNDRIQKWVPGADTGITVAGGNGYGSGENQLKNPQGVFVDSLNNIFVSDGQNARVQKFIPGNSAPLIDTTYRPHFGGMYNVTAVFADGCTAVSAPFHIKGLPRFRKIDGQKRNLCGGGTFIYSVKGDDKTTNYTWTVPSGCTILSGQGTDSIALSIPATGFVEGTISVTGDNRCGTGPATTAKLSTKPDHPGEITGPTEVGLNDTITYSIDPQPGINYRWMFPEGVTILSGQNTPMVTVSWTSLWDGNVILKAAACGAESSSRLTVTVTSAIAKSDSREERITKTTDGRIKLIPNPVSSKATIQFAALKAGKYTLQIREVTGKTILNQSGNTIIGENKITLDAAALNTGTYFIQLWLEKENRQLNISFQKQ